MWKYILVEYYTHAREKLFFCNLLTVFQMNQILGSFIVIRIGYVDNSFIKTVQQEKEQKA